LGADVRTTRCAGWALAWKETQGEDVLSLRGSEILSYLFFADFLATFLAAFFAVFFAGFFATFLAVFFTVFFTATFAPLMSKNKIRLKS
jgi:hypothetical protein